MKATKKERKELPRIGITMGDPNGIGPELILKILQEKELLDECELVLYGSIEVLEHYHHLLGVDLPAIQELSDPSELEKGRVGMIRTWESPFKPEPGKTSKNAGEFAYQALKLATQHTGEGKLDALVTAPLNKWTVRTDERPFPGHTEFLGGSFDVADPLMLMMSESLRVGVITGHISLQQVSRKVSEELILSKIGTLEQSLRRDLSIDNPRIAVLGLNPHAGESGMLGKEEKEVIAPVIERARKEKGWDCHGPLPADGLFGSKDLSEYDAVLAMYHDQGLIPFKALSFGYGVNFTAGLPIVRTSPDHGTAYSLAGKGVASPSSFRSAILTAIEIQRNRSLHEGEDRGLLSS